MSTPTAYGQVGFMLASLMGKLDEWQVRPRFMEACGRGLVTYLSAAEMKKNIYDRLVICVAPGRGEDAIRDMGKLFAANNNDKEADRYFRLFDPHQNYAANPSGLDKFSNHSFKISNKGKKKPTRAQLMDERWRHAHGIYQRPTMVGGSGRKSF